MPWNGLDNIIRDVEQRASTLPQKVGAVIGTLDEPLANEMQQGATWTDQTGDARAGLQAETTVNGTTVTLSLFDDPALFYVWWLLTRHGGRYDIISRTAETTPPRIADALREVFR